MITNPQRLPISFCNYDMTPKLTRLRFNTIEMPKRRCKLRFNKRVAFMSSCARFKDLEALHAFSADDEKIFTKIIPKCNHKDFVLNFLNYQHVYLSVSNHYSHKERSTEANDQKNTS